MNIKSESEQQVLDQTLFIFITPMHIVIECDTVLI